ncbi:hypothetical protein DL770_001709 [Monosporascus sp. CRB-9-2]|nr:hypothetical protein DL770_001709 [Monosporascus sp. CRB-9-2]
MTTNCNKSYKVKSGDGCAAIAQNNGISLSNYYVYVRTVGFQLTETTQKLTKTGGNGAQTPTPTQTGMVGQLRHVLLRQEGRHVRQPRQARRRRHQDLRHVEPGG